MTCEVDKGVILGAFNCGHLCYKSRHKSADRDSDAPYCPHLSPYTPGRSVGLGKKQRVLRVRFRSVEFLELYEDARCRGARANIHVTWYHELTEIAPTRGEQESSN